MTPPAGGGTPSAEDDDAHGSSGAADGGDQIEKIAERVYRLMTQDMRLEAAHSARLTKRTRG